MKKEWLQEMKRFCEEESGVGVVEIILVLVVIVGLILIFKKQLTSLVNKAFSHIIDKAGTLYMRPICAQVRLLMRSGHLISRNYGKIITCCSGSRAEQMWIDLQIYINCKKIWLRKIRR